MDEDLKQTEPGASSGMTPDEGQSAPAPDRSGDETPTNPGTVAPPPAAPVAPPAGPTAAERIGRTLVWLCAFSLLLGVLVLFRGGGAEAPSQAFAPEGDPFAGFPLLAGADGIAIVNVYGVISFEQEQSSFPGMPTLDMGADRLVRILRRLRKTDRVKGVVLRVNSPGGTVGASQEISNQVKALVAEGKKVVVSMGDVAASGGYYISAPASYIFANAGTLTGSIGVISSVTNLSELIAKVGVKFEVIKSGKFKDMGSSYREMTEAERELFQRIITGAWDQFVDTVAEGRILDEEKDGRKVVLTSKETLRNEIAQGQIFLGSEAVKIGLVDEVGDFYAAIEKAGELCGLGKEPHIIKTGAGAGIEKLFELFGSSSTADPVRTIMTGGGMPPLMYLFAPGVR